MAGNEAGQHFVVRDGHIMQNPDAQLNNNMPSNMGIRWPRRDREDKGE